MELFLLFKQNHIFTMTDGHKIAATTYFPGNEKEIIGQFHILHGMAEHQRRYEGFANYLSELGYLVTTHDHRGHGDTAEENGGLFGYFAERDGFERVVQDVHEVLQQLSVLHHEYPLTLFGHSMGSFIARRYTQHYSNELDRVIYCGTGATTALHVVGNSIAKVLSRVQGGKTPSRIMNKLSFDSFNHNIADAVTNFDWICTDSQVVQKYIEDTQCGFIATNQFFVDLTSGLITIANPREIKKVRPDLPILFIAGSDDPVGESGKGVYKVAAQYEQAGVKDVTVYMFEGMRHEILNERNKQQVYDVVTRWMNNEEI